MRKVEARALVKGAINLMRSALGPLNPTLARQMDEFASAAEKEGDIEFASELRHRASEIAVLPETRVVTPPNAHDLRDSGNYWAGRADYDRAER